MGSEMCIRDSNHSDYQKIIANVKEYLYKEFEDKCMSELSKYPVLRTYRIVKSTFGLEPYLRDIRNFKLRCMLSKLRLSSHNLQIEKGRHMRPKQDVKDRVCRMCNSNDVEDECHLLLYCDLYNSERILLLQKCEVTLQSGMDPNEHLQSLLCSNDAFRLLQVAFYLRKCFKKRASYMYT